MTVGLTVSFRWLIYGLINTLMRRLSICLFWSEIGEAHADPEWPEWFNTLRPRQNGRHFADDIFKWIFLNENVWTSIKISLKFVPRGPISNIPSLVQIMAWRRSGDKPLSEPMMVKLLTHICVTRPQWVKDTTNDYSIHLEFWMALP